MAASGERSGWKSSQSLRTLLSSMRHLLQCQKGDSGGRGGVCLPGLGTTLSSSNEAACPLTWRIVMGGGRASPESNDDNDGLNVRIAGNSGEQHCLPQR